MQIFINYINIFIKLILNIYYYINKKNYKKK